MNELVGLMGLVLFVFFFLIVWGQKRSEKNYDEPHSKEWEEKMNEWEDDYF